MKTGPALPLEMHQWQPKRGPLTPPIFSSEIKGSVSRLLTGKNTLTLTSTVSAAQDATEEASCHIQDKGDQCPQNRTPKAQA